MTSNIADLKPKVFSFFSGAGFLDLGFEKSGFDVVYANEYHEPFMEAYKHSRKKMKLPQPKFGFSSDSITDISFEQLESNIKVARESGQPIGFIGGPPCPDFSVGGKNKGREGENGSLSKVYVELIIACKPDFFLFENVKGLWRTKKHRAFYEELKEALLASGYSVFDKLINAIDHGAPQDRDRIFMVGFLEQGNFVWPTSSLGDGVALSLNWPDQDEFEEDGYRPIPNSIRKELTVNHWFEKNDVCNHPNSTHHFTPRAGLTRFQSIPEGDDKKKSFKRLHRWRYSPTAAYGNNEVHLHPYKARRISAAEALAIQSLPKEFELPSDMTLSNMFKTIGNGVPFLLARSLAYSIRERLILDQANRSEFGPRHKQAS